MKKVIFSLVLSFIFIMPMACAEGNQSRNDNQWELRANRKYTSNFKDMVLARCVSKAYKFDKEVVKDANGSAGALFIM